MGINGNYLSYLDVGIFIIPKDPPMIGPPNDHPEVTPTISPEELDGQNHSYSNPGPVQGATNNGVFLDTLLKWTPAMEKHNIPSKFYRSMCQLISSHEPCNQT